jgi:phospholipase C
VVETNISSWRRAVCGDLTSAFQPTPSDPDKNLAYFPRDPFVEHIYQAQFKPLPNGYKVLTTGEIEQIQQDPANSLLMQHQEKGVRRSCPLPYELYVDGTLSTDRKQFTLRFEVKKDRFANRAVGCPFTVYARTGHNEMSIRNYAVSAGDTLEDSWLIQDFENGKYQLQVYGPNGFFREFIGTTDDPRLDLGAAYATVSSSDQKLSGNVELKMINHDGNRGFEVLAMDQSYKTRDQKQTVEPSSSATLIIDTQRNHCWYDVGVRILQSENFYRHFAGRVETGQWGMSDPAMGRMVGENGPGTGQP